MTEYNFAELGRQRAGLSASHGLPVPVAQIHHDLEIIASFVEMAEGDEASLLTAQIGYRERLIELGEAEMGAALGADRD